MVGANSNHGAVDKRAGRIFHSTHDSRFSLFTLHSSFFTMHYALCTMPFSELTSISSLTEMIFSTIIDFDEERRVDF